MGCALKDDRRHTYAEYLGWPEDVRYEQIDGQAFLMSPTRRRIVDPRLQRASHED
jgi:hypothetical protein